MRRTLLVGLMILAAGCHTPRRTPRDGQPVFNVPPPAPAGFGTATPGGFPTSPPGAPGTFPTAPLPGATLGAPPGAPPGAVSPFPTTPGPTSQFPTVPPGPAGSPPPPPPAQTPPPPGPMSKLESNWQPAEARVPAQAPPGGDNRVLLGPPEVVTDGGKGPAKQLYPPQVEATPGAKLPATSLPVGIPQFTPIKPSIATGRRPNGDDGLGWLQANKYRAVLHLRLPGENDDADRAQAGKRGLAYHSLEVSPALLTKDTVEAFFKVVRDAAGPNAEAQPLFVYDRDGSLAGGLWYLYFRLVDQDADDVARIRARAAGLREDRDGAYREAWQAVQRYLSDLGTK